uniref:Uncharacterized protein n=1 Tax=Arundo donax TaxID=35708 RepID=A0A0A9BC66_ARUDO
MATAKMGSAARPLPLPAPADPPGRTWPRCPSSPAPAKAPSFPGVPRASPCIWSTPTTPSPMVGSPSSLLHCTIARNGRPHPPPSALVATPPNNSRPPTASPHRLFPDALSHRKVATAIAVIVAHSHRPSHLSAPSSAKPSAAMASPRSCGAEAPRPCRPRPLESRHHRLPCAVAAVRPNTIAAVLDTCVCVTAPPCSACTPTGSPRNDNAVREILSPSLAGDLEGANVDHLLPAPYSAPLSS